MKTGLLLDPTAKLPDRLQAQITKNFLNQPADQLTIRYYEAVEDVGYEYFVSQVLPVCGHNPVIECLEPFISYQQLGEALVLASGGFVVYDSNGGDQCTETGPFWLVTTKDAVIV